MWNRVWIAGAVLALLGACDLREREVAERADEPYEVTPNYPRPTDAGTEVDRTAYFQDLGRALEEVEGRIARVQADTTLADEERRDVEALAKRAREVREDLEALETNPGETWNVDGDEIRARTRRIGRALDRFEQRET